MTVILILSVLLTMLYVSLMLLYRKGWQQQPEFSVPALYIPSTRISVIVPARNEQDNIGACLDSILAQTYPSYLFEVIVVDDHSEDSTAPIVAEYADRGVRCIRLADYLPMGKAVNAYKKMALATGIAQSSGALVVTTDADCIVPNAWLMHIAAIFEQRDAMMVVAPVIYKSRRKVLEIFQLIDFMSMQGITGAAHALKLGNMSNGANLAFRRSAFDQVRGYEGILDLASGDDFLLMMKMHDAAPDRIAYLKSANAAVTTLPQPTWWALLQQRIRWASKSGKYKDHRLTAILVLVYFFNLLVAILAVGSLFHPAFVFTCYSVFTIKTAVEFWFLRPVARFFHTDWALIWFPFLQPLHVTYIVLAGFLGFVGKYHWKGRTVK
jgi:cellulose synthase/poly-beta-1,6-N-acetylglucosamine synthase-like glycosyltransferase